MRFDTVIRNGTVVTATDTCLADVGINGDKVTAIAAQLPTENGGHIDVIDQQALAEGKRAPKYHALTRPTTAEAEATSRAIALAEMAGAPVYIVHLSCNEALEKVREARDRGLPVYAETCPQYLYLSLENMDAP